MQVKKQQLELDMEQRTGSELGKEYVKAVYCHPVLCNFMQVDQMVKNPPAMQEIWVRFLGWQDSLEEGMATHSSILAPMDRGAWWATVHGVTKGQM